MRSPSLPPVAVAAANPILVSASDSSPRNVELSSMISTRSWTGGAPTSCRTREITW